MSHADRVLVLTCRDRSGSFPHVGAPAAVRSRSLLPVSIARVCAHFLTTGCRRATAKRISEDAALEQIGDEVVAILDYAYTRLPGWRVVGWQRGHKKDGFPRGNYAKKGQLVCRNQGGASPRARAAAERRLASRRSTRTSPPGASAVRTWTRASPCCDCWRRPAPTRTCTRPRWPGVAEHGLQEALVGDRLVMIRTPAR
jgi:hypothetical protein